MNILILESIWVLIFEEDEEFYALMAKNEEKELIILMDFREMTSPFGGKKQVSQMIFMYFQVIVKWAQLGNMFERMSIDAVNKGWDFVRWITAEDNYSGGAAYDKIAKK